MAEAETLLDDLRRRTRSFTSRLREDDVFGLGRDIARELVRAHAESPQRHPSLDPATIPLAGGKPSLGGSRPGGDSAEDLFLLGALLNSLAANVTPDVAWRLDGPPLFPATTLARRHVLAALGSPSPSTRFATAQAALEALEAALAPAAAADAAWGLHRGDPGRGGFRERSAGATRFDAVWESAVGAVVASPILAGPLALAATADGRLLFLDRASGRRIHEMRLASGVESSPAVSGRWILIGTDDGELAAVDLVDGALRYRVKLGEMIRSSPLPIGARVLVGVIEPKGAGALVALDRETGKTVWRRKLGPVFSSPAFAPGRVVVGSDDGSLHAFDPETGAPAWSAPLGGKVRATPALTAELAVVGDFSGRVTAVRLDDGSPVWSRELGESVYSSAAIAAGLCAMGCHDGTLRGLDLATGEVRFEVRTRGPLVASPVAVGDRLFVGSTDGDAYLLDAAGAVLQRTPAAEGGIQSSAAVDGELVVFGSSRGLHAVALRP